MKKINVGVIGVGNMGKNHARVYYGLPHVNLVSIADINPKICKSVADKYKAKFYSSYKKMLAQEDLAALSIAVPTPLHYSVAKDAISRKKHVLIEKPITAKISQAKKLIKLANKHKVHLAVGHIERFNPVVVRLKKILEKNTIGQVASITAIRVGLSPPNIKGSDVLIDLAIHDIDIFNFLLDSRPSGLYACGGNSITTTSSDYAQIILNYPGNIAAHIEVNWITPVKIREIKITGTNGVIKADYINQDLTVYSTNFKKDFKNFKDFVRKFGKAKVNKIKLTIKEPLHEELNSFTKSIIYNKPQQVDGPTATIALEIAEKCRQHIIRR